MNPTSLTLRTENPVQSMVPANSQELVAISDPRADGRIDAIGVDAAGAIGMFAGISMRTWRRWDSSGRCPAGFSIGRRKLWRVWDLRRWAEMGFPRRAEFEALKQGGITP